MNIGVYDKSSKDYFVVKDEDVERLFGVPLSRVKRAMNGKTVIPDKIFVQCGSSAQLRYPEGKS